MHIDKMGDFAFPVAIADQLFRVVDRWVQIFVWEWPFAVEVLAQQRAAIIAYYHAIRVQHWDDLEHKVLPELFGQIILGQQKPQGPLEHKRSLWLTWVHPGREHNRLLVRVVTQVALQFGAPTFLKIGLLKALLRGVVKRGALFFKGSLQQLLHFGFRFGRLFEQFTALLVLGFELLAEGGIQVRLDPELICHRQISFHSVCDRQDWHGPLLQTVAQDFGL